VRFSPEIIYCQKLDSFGNISDNITQNNGHYAFQGLSRSPLSVSITLHYIINYL